MSVKFEIPYFTVSGVTVRWTHLLLFDRSPCFPMCQVSQNYREVWLSGYIYFCIPHLYLCTICWALPMRLAEASCILESQALPWVRYITQNGDYQLRMVWHQVATFVALVSPRHFGGLTAASFDNDPEQPGDSAAVAAVAAAAAAVAAVVVVSVVEAPSLCRDGRLNPPGLLLSRALWKSGMRNWRIGNCQDL